MLTANVKLVATHHGSVGLHRASGKMLQFGVSFSWDAPTISCVFGIKRRKGSEYPTSPFSVIGLTNKLSEGTDLLLGSVPHGVFLLGLGDCERIRSLRLQAGGVEGVVLVVLLGLVLAKGAFLYISVDISQICRIV